MEGGGLTGGGITGGGGKGGTLGGGGGSPFELRAPRARKFGAPGQVRGGGGGVAEAARGLAGRGRKGARAGSLAAARGEAERRREATLLEDHRARGGANVFDDRRILGSGGAGGPGGGAAVAAFRAERRREQRQKLYALAEDEGPEGDLLTHGGVPLGEAGGFLGAGLGARADEEGDDGGFLEKELTQQLHFGGGGGGRWPPEEQA